MSSPDQDSDAPEDVSFSTGKADAIRDLEIEKVERNKQENSLKEWRRKRDAQYREQKEKKLLSLDVLIKADAEIKKRRLDKEKLTEGEKEDIASDGDSLDLEDTDDEKDSDVEEAEAENQDEDGSEDEGTQEVRIAIVDSKRPRSLMQTALDFKARSLYGAGIKRIDMSQVRSRSAKRKITNKIRKDWIKSRKLKNAG